MPRLLHHISVRYLLWPWFRPFCAEAIHCCRLISSLKEDAHAVHNDFGW